MWLKGLQSMGYDWKVEYPTANKQNHRVKIKILFWSLLLTQEKEPEWRVKLSAVTLSNRQCPSSFHRPGQHCFVAGNPHVRWLAGAAVSASLWSEDMTFCSYAAYCIVWRPHLPFALQKLSANIDRWVSQSRSVQHEEIPDDRQQGCWIWPCITQLQGMGFTFINGTPEILQCFSDSKTLTNIMESGGQSG